MTKYSTFSICFILLTSFSSCLKKTNTSRCAYEERFDFENDCRDVETSKPYDGDLTVYTLTFTGKERFYPTLYSDAENLISYVLAERDKGAGPIRVMANYITNEHWYIGKTESGSDVSALKFSRDKNHIIQWAEFCEFDHSNYLIKNCNKELPAIGNTSWEPNKNNNVLVWVRESFNDALTKELAKYNDEYRLARTTKDLESFEVIKVLKGGFKMSGGMAFLSENEFATVIDHKLVLVDIKNETSEVWLEDNEGAGFYNISNQFNLAWNDATQELFICVPGDGIYKMQKGKKRQKRIKKSCPSRSYGYILLVDNETKIIAQRKDIKAERDGTYISENTKLVIMDIDGCNEKVLFEDWDGTVIGRP